MIARNHVTPTTVILVLCLSAGRAQATRFIPLGDLPGGDFVSQASAVSADGSVVVGWSRSQFPPPGEDSDWGIEAFRWTSDEGMVGLGDLPGGLFRSTALGISADGSVIVGETASHFSNTQEAFSWTSTGGMVGLGDQPGGFTQSAALGVSPDGSTVVGFSFQTMGEEAFRWTEAGGMVGLGALPANLGGFFSQAYDASADGSVIVGRSQTSNTPLTHEAFRWTEVGGMVSLGRLPGIAHSGANAVSADGSVIVGGSVSRFSLGGIAFPPAEAWRWTALDDMVGLGDLPGGDVNSSALGVSADGSVVVGFGATDLGSEAFIWDAANGMRNLRNVLIASGATGLSGWTLREATAVSADGRTIVGFGRNPSGQTEAWIAVIPEPSSLLQMVCAAAAGIVLLRRRVTSCAIHESPQTRRISEGVPTGEKRDIPRLFGTAFALA